MEYNEKSCGCIIIDKDRVLLVKHNAGHWDFPKGHMEDGETEIETAIREVKEETNLDVKEEDLKLITIVSGNTRRFRYTTKQAKFSQDNKVKQKALSLGEDLINFLNDNNIKNCFVEPLVGFINNEVVVINMPLTDEDLFIEELLNKIRTATVKLDSETIDKCAVLINKYAADCSSEI